MDTERASTVVALEIASCFFALIRSYLSFLCSLNLYKGLVNTPGEGAHFLVLVC